MKKAGKDVRLIIYPGVGRGFDFRPPAIRTFADDLATKDSHKSNLLLEPESYSKNQGPLVYLIDNFAQSKIHI